MKYTEGSATHSNPWGQQHIEYLVSNFEQQPETDKLLALHPDKDTNQKPQSIQESTPPVPHWRHPFENVEFGIPLEEPPKSNLQLWSVHQFLYLSGSQERQEKRLNEALETFRQLQTSIHSLETKVDKAIGEIAKLDYLHDEALTKSFVEILNIGKGLIAVGEVLGKALGKGASPVVAKQELEGKRRRL